MRFTKVVPVLGAALLFSASSLSAQDQTCLAVGGPPITCFLSNTASATVSDIVRLTLSGNGTNATTSATALGDPTEADFDVGAKLAGGPIATAKSNRPYTVSVQSHGASNFTGPYAKLASDLHWNTTATAIGTYTKNVATSTALIGPTAAGTPQAGTAQGIFYETKWVYANDIPGNYSIVVDFTISAP